MKKKGFTLVELLAVIAILALLVIVAMPNVLGMFNQAKLNSFVIEVQKIMDTATNEFTKDALENSGKTVYYSSESNATLKTKQLDMSGNKKNYFIEMDRNGYFKRVVVFDANYCYDIYSSGTNAKLDTSKSKQILEKIDKTIVVGEDVWEAGNDSISITINGNNYIVKGCDGSVGGIGANGQTLYSVLENEALNGTLAKKYTGSHKDSYTASPNKEIYHFYASSSDNDSANLILNKNNVLFANHCWQMMRTTDTGGVKLLYNGIPENGMCNKNRSSHHGFMSASYETFSGTNYYYADSYVYNESTRKYKLSGNIFSSTWSEDANLVGKYTCESADRNAECSYLTLIVNYHSNSQGYTFSIGNTVGYAFIGGIPYNKTANDVTSVGYMYNDRYGITGTSGSFSSAYHGKSFKYENGKYHLIDYKKITSAAELNTYRYMCPGGGNSTSCTNLGYAFLYYGGTTHYMLFYDGFGNSKIALDNMLKTNKYDSNVKIVVDKWYEENLLSYSSYIEDTIYCNDRTPTNFESTGWNPNGGSVSEYLEFSTYSDTNLKCESDTDSFSLSNPNAKLKYPIALATLQEFNLLKNTNLYNVGSRYRLMTPNEYTGWEDYRASVYIIGFYGSITGNDDMGDSIGVRPVISLKPGVTYLSGDGSVSNPYKIN